MKNNKMDDEKHVPGITRAKDLTVYLRGIDEQTPSFCNTVLFSWLYKLAQEPWCKAVNFPF